ncbi:unnamed protein product, partial [Rotaria sordida]
IDCLGAFANLGKMALYA